MSGFKSATIRGAWWISGMRVFRILVSLVTLSILSRFLSAEEFGIAGLIIVVTGLAQVIGDVGTRLALVQKAEITPLEIDSVFWMNLTIGLALTGLTIAFAAPIAGLFDTPAMAEPLRWASSVFLITAIQGVPNSLLERGMRFRELALGEAAGTAAGAITAIILVLLGFQLGALIAQLIMFSLFACLMVNLQARWRPRLRFSFGALTPMLGFGAWASFASLITFIGANAERPILAAALSTAALGYFTLAAQIVQTPLRTIVQVVRTLTLPVFARMQDDPERARRAYLNVCHALMVVMSPICFGLIAVAGDATTLFLGQDKGAVVPLVMILSLRALIGTLTDIHGSILTAWGRMRFQFGWALASTVVTIGVLWGVAPRGLEAAVLALLVLTALMVPVFAFPVLRRLDLLNSRLPRTIAPPLISGAIMCLAVREAAVRVPMSPAPGLLTGVILGGTVYVLCQLLLDRSRCMELFRAVARRRSKVAVPA
ncbi:lipopolysaccharide biosynthesis protein [Falsirhodobacter sp. 20TX0035]|uniref:lipopolysaccharide biosynthesis protein n=1 Tax=Falsirhodobacter sp. 20TX0035 TaxID=3022019 RepID=UPI00232DCC42|nr:lipopolysaccharide biosynthesis protein [Falsirhodobacter sp. 20TX0035]MDB6454293.1 lipopolysaccharide biosynthesis protein [Falsirhodobacter sp. 20TX0035]